MALVLWMTPSPMRFFLVPDDVPWPEGDDRVHDVLGDEREVDLEALARHEVSDEEARAWSVGERTRMSAELDARQQGEVVEEADLASLGEALRQLSAGFGPDQARVLVNRLGLDMDRMLADPERTATLWAEVLATLSRAADPRQRSRVLSELQKILRRYGYPKAAAQLKKAPASLRPILDDLERLARAYEQGPEREKAS